MTSDTERYIAIAQQVAARAQEGTLPQETALKFCAFVLPDLLVEWEIVRRVGERLAQFPAVPQQAPGAEVPPPAPPVKAKKKAAKKSRSKRRVTDDRSAS